MGQPLGVRRDLSPNRLPAQLRVPGRLSLGRSHRDAAGLWRHVGRAAWAGSIHVGRASPGRSLARMRGCTLRSPCFPPCPNPPGGRLGPVQARGGKQHRLLQTSPALQLQQNQVWPCTVAEPGIGHGITLGCWCRHCPTATSPVLAQTEVGVSLGSPPVWLSWLQPIAGDFGGIRI